MAYTMHETTEDVLICTGACVSGDVVMGKGVSVWHNAVIRGDKGPVVIGEGTNIQDGAILHSGSHVGAGTSVGHGAIVHGCNVGNNVLIGMGSVILNGAKIGDRCIIGAGSLVLSNTEIPSGSLVLGHPAKVIRSLTEADFEYIRHNAQEYLLLAESYRKG